MMEQETMKPGNGRICALKISSQLPGFLASEFLPAFSGFHGFLLKV
jgi:hypothetical protein